MNDRLMEYAQNRVFEARREYEKASLKYLGHRTFDAEEEYLKNESERAWTRYEAMRNFAIELGVQC